GVLPDGRASIAAARKGLEVAFDDEARGEEEAGVEHSIRELQERGGLERREREEKEEGRDQLRPDEDRHAEEGHAVSAELKDRRDDVDRSEERRRDQEDHADQPEDLAGRGSDR